MVDYVVELVNLVSFCKEFEGKSREDLCRQLNVVTNAKSKNFILSTAIISKYNGKGFGNALLKQQDVRVKTIQLKENGKAKEAMSFSPIDYQAIIGEQWENSKFRKYLSGKFLFFVFKYIDGINYLYKIIFWGMPKDDLDGEVKDIWLDVQKKISSGNIVLLMNGKMSKTKFPAEKDTHICHVRPHGANSLDLIKLPVTDVVTGYNYFAKQSFWFNHEYLNKIIEEN